MRFLLISIFTFFTFSFLNAQIVVLLDENFNNGFPSGWQVIDNDGLTPHPSVSYVTSGFGVLEDSDSTGIGDSIVACTSYFTPVGTADNYLILPQTLLKNHGNILYWDVKSQDPSFPDGYEILVSTTLPVIDSFQVDTSLFYTDAELPDWTQRSISLDDYAGQNIYVAFHHFSPDKFILKLDNIRIIADTTLAIHENENDIAFSVYPNPALNQINISSNENWKNTVVSIHNSVGKIVYNGINSRSIDVSNFSNGLYFLRVTSENKTGIRRFVIQR